MINDNVGSISEVLMSDEALHKSLVTFGGRSVLHFLEVGILLEGLILLVPALDEVKCVCPEDAI